MKTITATLFFILLLANLTACRTQRFHGHASADNNLLLQGKQQAPTLYLLHNLTNQPLYLNHETGHGMSAGWASKIDSGKWSAFLVDKPHFSLICQTSTFKTITCKHHIAVLAQAIQPLTKQQIGTYWVAENQAYTALLSEIKKRKIKRLL